MKNNIEDIRYIPNIVDKELQKSILDVVEDNDNFAWYYSPSIVEGKQDSFGFGHNLYINGEQNSHLFDKFYPVLEAFQEITKKSIHYFIRVRVRMTLPITGKSYINLPHTDFDYPHSAFVYYINESDGDTVFYDKFKGDNISDMKEVVRFSPKMGDLVTFDGLRYHSGATPSKSRRLILNVDFI